ncbi:MAG: hypothetical protein H6719_14620 [Sandaracinaceae bacterium]|nr:hypothetical protein [Sandaracinaceae bacterium]
MRSLLFAIALLTTAPSLASAQEGTRALFIPSGSVPSHLRRTLENLIATRATLVSYDTYSRAAAERDLYPSNNQAIREIATQQGADVIVVASYGGHYRRRMLTLRYYNGSTGELARRRSHGLRGQALRPASQHSVLRDLAEVAGGASDGGGEAPPDEDPEGGDGAEGGDGGDGGLPPPVSWEEPGAEGEGGEGSEPAASEGESEAENRQWGFAIQLGLGIMQRQSAVPMMAGPARLSTTPFPAIQAQVQGYFRPDLTSRLRISLISRYTTSVGLQAQDYLVDGTTRTTDMRAHHLTIGLRTDIPLAPGDHPTELVLEAGWAFRMLDSEIMVSIPDYTLHGIYARVGLFFSVGDTPLSIGIIPEIGHMMNLSEELSQSSMVGDGFHVGAEAHVRLQIIPEVAVLLMYRESHAFLGTGLGEDMNDVERYGILKAEYHF